MEIMTSTIFSVQYCLENPDYIYVFGENQAQKNTKAKGGGQAIIRGCENAFGFCTLSSIGEYWTDDHFKTNIVQIEADILGLKKKAERYTGIIFPASGLGTGRAMMQRNCPRTFLYMCTRLLEEFNFNNLANLESSRF